MTLVETLGTVGVGLLLVAFLLTSSGHLDRRRRVYQVLNLAGATLACVASYMIGFVPFVVLEGTWALVALGALVQRAAAGD